MGGNRGDGKVRSEKISRKGKESRRIGRKNEVKENSMVTHLTPQTILVHFLPFKVAYPFKLWQRAGELVGAPSSGFCAVILTRSDEVTDGSCLIFSGV